MSEQILKSRAVSPTPEGSSVDHFPKLGYRNYWYPAVDTRTARARPRHLRLLGDDVVLFRDPRSGTAPYARRSMRKQRATSCGMRY